MNTDPAVKLEFQGGAVAIARPLPRALTESALSWLSVAQDARQRARMHRERGHFQAALEAERCVGHSLERAEMVLAELRNGLME